MLFILSFLNLTIEEIEQDLLVFSVDLNDAHGDPGPRLLGRLIVWEHHPGHLAIEEDRAAGLELEPNLHNAGGGKRETAGLLEVEEEAGVRDVTRQQVVAH